MSKQQRYAVEGGGLACELSAESPKQAVEQFVSSVAGIDRNKLPATITVSVARIGSRVLKMFTATVDLKVTIQAGASVAEVFDKVLAAP